MSPTTRDETLTLAVADEGPGVPAAERERVVEPFYRRDEARTPGRSGFGLGLTLARRVAEAHGGTLAVGPAHVADSGVETGCKVSISLSVLRPLQNVTNAPGSP